MVIKTLDVNEMYLYDDLLETASSSYIFQTRPYLTSLSLLGYDFEILGIFENDNLKYALPVQKKKFPLINRYFYAIPYGVVSKEEIIPNEVVDNFINYLKKKGLVIKLSLNQKLENNQFKYKSMQTTLMLDLSKGLDEIFSNFSKTHRNCTRRAAKDGVVVTIEKNEEIINEFLNLYQQMVDRKAIESLPVNFLSHVLKELTFHNMGFFAVARFNGVIHNIAFISTVGRKARYLYGASLRTEEKVPPIGQFLHYEIIKYLIDKNFISYDFGGIPNPPVLETDSSYSVYKFKKGFGGEVKELCYDYQYIKYKILKLLIR